MKKGKGQQQHKQKEKRKEGKLLSSGLQVLTTPGLGGDLAWRAQRGKGKKNPFYIDGIKGERRKPKRVS